MELDLFKNYVRIMMLQDESLYNVIDEFIETLRDFTSLHEFIDTEYPYLSKYIILDDDSEEQQREGLVYYMETIADRAKKNYLEAYLVANYLTKKRPDLIKASLDDTNETLGYELDVENSDDPDYQRELLEEYYKSDEELEEMYMELEAFATINKPKVNNVKVSNNLATLFDEVKGNNGTTVVDHLDFQQKRARREKDIEPVKLVNTEQYAKLLVEYIKALLTRAKELNKTEGYILARYFEDYGLGRLKYGDRNRYWEKYSADSDDYLISSRDFDENDLKSNPDFDTLDCFSMDKDTLTLRLNFSYVYTGNDRGDPFNDGGIPKYNNLDFDYLVKLLWDQGITVERESNHVPDSSGWQSTNTEVLTIRYYRNEKRK